MKTLRDSILQGAAEIQKDLEIVLGGMDYYLDWKPHDSEWSTREVLWHILEDPEGGIPKAIEGIIKGTLPELTIIADETHLDPEREAMDLETINGEIRNYFTKLNEVLEGVTDSQISQLTTSCWFPLRNHREDRSAQNLLEGLLINHWRDHLPHLRHLRASLEL